MRIRIRTVSGGLGVLVALLTLAAPVRAQLGVSLRSQRDTFLLYEPMIFYVRLQNTSGEMVALQDHPVSGRPWLAFQIFNAHGEKIAAAGKYSVPSEVLRPGEVKNVQVNITPLYRIRDTGQYDIQAAVSNPGGSSYVTGKIRFHVGKGEVIWQKEDPGNGVVRRYSLIRFLENTTSSLYFRVEEPGKNLVYSTSRLGLVAGFTKPEVRFDKENKIHVLHVSSSTLYRYTRLSNEGAIEYQEDREVSGVVPALVTLNDGVVQLEGGRNIRAQAKRRKLSQDQMGL